MEKAASDTTSIPKSPLSDIHGRHSLPRKGRKCMEAVRLSQKVRASQRTGHVYLHKS